MLHGSVVVLLLVQVVTKFPQNHVLLRGVESSLLREIDGKNIKIPLIQYVKLLSERFFVIPENLTYISMELEYTNMESHLAIDGEHEQVTPFGHYGFNL